MVKYDGDWKSDNVKWWDRENPANKVYVNMEYDNKKEDATDGKALKRRKN